MHERSPRLFFGSGSIGKLAELARACGRGRGGDPSDLVLVLGGSSFKRGPRYGALRESAERSGFRLHEFSCSGEPSSDFVDQAAAQLRNACGAEALAAGCAVVAGIGGGSALDAGKAVAAMAALHPEPEGTYPSVAEYLEGVGTRTPPGLSLPFIACPTTAGTGSEATKNAVLSRIGAGGFKKSLRHEGYVPSAAIVDPALAVDCPRSVTAAGGLDALTQLIEAWTSPLASPVVAALCRSGVEAVSRSFAAVLADGSDLDARSGMAYGAYLSGVALANAGLGAVHGLASPVGGRFAVPHGLVCGTLLAPACALNIDRLRALMRALDEYPKAAASLAAYAQAGYILAGREAPSWTAVRDAEREVEEGCSLLLSAVEELVRLADLPPWTDYGFEEAAIPDLARAAAAKTNPVPLDAPDYEELLRSAMRR